MKKDQKVKKSLDALVKDGAWFSVGEGFADRYLNALAVVLNATPLQIGFLMSFPQFIGSLFQFLTIKILDQTKKRKSLILIPVFLQALTRGPILLLPFLFPVTLRVTLLFLCTILYFSFGSIAGPAWNSMMGDLVDINERGDYFGKRNRYLGIVSFFSLVIGGFILNKFEQQGIILYGFIILFAIAFFARLISWYYLSKMHDPPYQYAEKDKFNFHEYLGYLRRTNHGLFVSHCALIIFSVNIAGPFFAQYMLEDLGFSYLQYMVITGSAVLAGFFTMSIMGKLSDRFGNKRMLTISSIIIVLIPFTWLFAKDFWFLTLWNFFAGMAWAAFTLASSNFVFDTVKPSKRARVFAYISILNAGCALLGALLGGWLLRQSWSGLQYPFYLALIFSFVTRALTCIIFIPKYREVRKVESVKTFSLFFYFLVGAPYEGIRYEVFTGFNRGILGLKKAASKSVYSLKEGYQSIHRGKKKG